MYSRIDMQTDDMLAKFALDISVTLSFWPWPLPRSFDPGADRSIRFPCTAPTSIVSFVTVHVF